MSRGLRLKHFLVWLQNERVYGVLIIGALHYCSILLTSLKHVHHKTAINLLKTRFFSDSLIINSIHPKITLIIRCIIVCTKVPSPKRTTDSLLGPQCFATRGQKEEEFVQCCRLFFYNMATCLMQMPNCPIQIGCSLFNSQADLCSQRIPEAFSSIPASYIFIKKIKKKKL